MVFDRVPVVSVDFNLILSMTLIATAGTPTGNANFAETASLGPIFVGDANGNPIPGANALQLVGDLVGGALWLALVIIK